MFDRDRARMLAVKDFSDPDTRAIQAPTLIFNGDGDVVRPEHALALMHALRHAQLAIPPGRHGDYIGEICSKDTNSKIPILVTAIIETFLEARRPSTE